jgi:hypothetical protein
MVQQEYVKLAPREYVVHVTPELAASWLARRHVNPRSLKHLKIEAFARQMRQGHWRAEVCPPLLRNGKGEVVDGQHRLLAVIQSGCTVPFHVRDGVPDDAVIHVDTGTSRSFADVLKMEEGLKNHNAVAAVVAKAEAWERVGANRARLFWGTRGTATHEEKLAFFRAHADRLIHAVTLGDRAAKATGMGRSIVSFAMWLFMNIDVEDAEYFAERVVDCADLPDGHPILALRRATVGRSRASTDARTPDVVQLAYLIKAWNAFRRGDMDVRQIKFRPGGAHAERFPEPV